MGAKNGKDCKHGGELSIDLRDEFHGEPGIIYYLCGDCKEEIDPKEIVIFTKEQHQLYVDLEEAVGIALKSYHTPGDDAYSDEMISLKEALDALKVDK